MGVLRPLVSRQARKATPAAQKLRMSSHTGDDLATNDEPKGIEELDKCQGQDSSTDTFCIALTAVWGSVQRQARASVGSDTSHCSCL